MNNKKCKRHNSKGKSGLSKKELEEINSKDLSGKNKQKKSIQRIINFGESSKIKDNKISKASKKELKIKSKKNKISSFNKSNFKSNKDNRTIIKLSFTIIIVLIVIIYALVSIIKLIKNPTTTVFIKEGVIAKEETDEGYIIRDEEVVKGDNYKNGMEQIIGEGQKVAKNQSIFRYYSNNEEDLKKQIKNLDGEIEKAIGENKDLFSSDTKMLDTQISDNLYKINNIKDVQKIQEVKKNIDDFLTKKAQIAGELSPKGSHLKDLINERNDYLSQLTDDSEYIVSPRSGILSYRVDGLEETLTTEDFSKYNQEFLTSLNLKTGQINATNTEQGKIVNSFECYIACTSKTEEAREAKIGDKVKIILPTTREVDASIEYIIHDSDNETTLVLKFENGISELLNYRKITFDIVWWESKGYKVPNSAIFSQNNLNYVLKTKMGILEKVLVKLGKRTDNFTIVENYTSAELRDLEVDKTTRTSISINDEIILEPTKDQIDSTQ